MSGKLEQILLSDLVRTIICQKETHVVTSKEKVAISHGCEARIQLGVLSCGWKSNRTRQFPGKIISEHLGQPMSLPRSENTEKFEKTVFHVKDLWVQGPGQAKF